MNNVEQWIVWCGYNAEQDLMCQRLEEEGISFVSVHGNMTPEKKVDLLNEWLAGDAQVMVTKISVFGFGLNFQSCHNMAFCGLGDSYEDYYQAIRRCYRFGQKERVSVSIVLSDIEDTIYQNVLRKEREASELSNELIKHVIEFEKAEIRQTGKESMSYMTKDVTGDSWRIMLGDSAERLKEIPGHSVDLSVFSPPFQNLYTYSNSERDLGNCKDPAQFWQHFSFISRELLRVMKPGRIVCCHVQQIATQKAKDGEIGLFDFRGDTIRHFREQGFIYHGEVCIDKDPQAQAIRTKSKALLFTQFHKDSSWSRPALADYILLFRAPGDNAVPIKPDVTNNEWIEYARPIWFGIKESDTLNVVEARSEEDERHICPLQLGTIERCIRLWSNQGDTVLDPFNGIGSTGYEAILTGRKYIGVELNPVYFQVAVKNLQKAESETKQDDLFSLAGIAV